MFNDDETKPVIGVHHYFPEVNDWSLVNRTITKHGPTARITGCGVVLQPTTNDPWRRYRSMKEAEMEICPACETYYTLLNG